MDRVREGLTDDFIMRTFSKTRSLGANLGAHSHFGRTQQVKCANYCENNWDRYQGEENTLQKSVVLSVSIPNFCAPLCLRMGLRVGEGLVTSGGSFLTYSHQLGL